MAPRATVVIVLQHSPKASSLVKKFKVEQRGDGRRREANCGSEVGGACRTRCAGAEGGVDFGFLRVSGGCAGVAGEPGGNRLKPVAVPPKEIEDAAVFYARKNRQ